MLLFAELQMQGNKHVNVNSGLLNIISNSFPKEPIRIVCDKFHFHEISKYIKKNNQLQPQLFNYTGTKELKKIFTLNKVIRECVLIIRIFHYAKANNVKVLFFASIFPFTSIFLNLIAYIYNKKIIIALHGDLGVLKLKSHKITTILFRNSIRFFLKHRCKNIRLLFYGETIVNELSKLNRNFTKDNDIYIDHPYNYSFNIKNVNNNSKIVISNIGVGILNKNSQYIFKIAKIFENEISSKKIEFKQIGNISKEVLFFKNDFVQIINNNRFLPYDIFKENVLISDYFIYFFVNDSLYDLCPSGTFFDAIKYEKPIIAFKTSYFEYYFNKLGNIGYLCEDLSEMESVIKNIFTLHRSNYDKQVENLKNAKNILSIDEISKTFYDQYHNL